MAISRVGWQWQKDLAKTRGKRLQYETERYCPKFWEIYCVQSWQISVPWLISISFRFAWKIVKTFERFWFGLLQTSISKTWLISIDEKKRFVSIWLCPWFQEVWINQNANQSWFQQQTKSNWDFWWRVQSRTSKTFGKNSKWKNF